MAAMLEPEPEIKMTMFFMDCGRLSQPFHGHRLHPGHFASRIGERFCRTQDRMAAMRRDKKHDR
jgi:hypothetical protein